MRVVLTIPDDVVTAEVYVKSKDDAITHSRIFEGGSITNSRFIDKEETMGMRYTEGLEKRIDELEAGLGKVYESLENNYNELDTAIDAVRIDAEAFKSLPKSTGEVDATANRGVYTDILRRLCRLENRLEDVEKQAVVAEGVRKQLAEDIKATNGRIQDLEEKTGQSRDPLWAY